MTAPEGLASGLAYALNDALIDSVGWLCRGWVGFSVPMSHRITAACDMLLMPSRFEPCGLNQLYAMNYGTVPIVHAVGGLRETVQQFNPFEKTGTGWQFERAESNSFKEACGNALMTYKEHREDFQVCFLFPCSHVFCDSAVCFRLHRPGCT